VSLIIYQSSLSKNSLKIDEDLLIFTINCEIEVALIKILPSFYQQFAAQNSGKNIT